LKVASLRLGRHRLRALADSVFLLGVVRGAVCRRRDSWPRSVSSFCWWHSRESATSIGFKRSACSAGQRSRCELSTRVPGARCGWDRTRRAHRCC
jgi:hypothetical protein